jgi:hypothetical protein
VGLDKFIEIHVQEVSRYTKVASEVEALVEVDYTVFLMRILYLISTYCI